jgi:hypothetical protein
MGVDFITTCTKTFEKSWDRGRKELAAPTLFTDIPKGQRQTFVVTPRPSRVLTNGRWYEVAIIDEHVVLMDGIDAVGDFTNIPKFALQRITESGCGVAAAYAHSIHEMSGAADVTLR